MQKVDQNDKPYPRHTKTTGSIERQTRVVIAELFWINLDFQNIEYKSKFSFLSPIYTSIKNDDLIYKDQLSTKFLVHQKHRMVY